MKTMNLTLNFLLFFSFSIEYQKLKFINLKAREFLVPLFFDVFYIIPLRPA